MTTVETLPLVRRESLATTVGCRVLDVVASATLLALTAPLLLALAIAIRIETRGPAVFRQRRIGRGLEPFTVHKLRTMHDGVDDSRHRHYVHELIAGRGVPHGEEQPVFKLSDDERVTPLGRFLRRTSLDELPQLWDVLMGSMSLVGPRPPLAYEVERYPAPWFARFAVKPGVSGLWQVNGRSSVTLERMIELDLEYVERRSLWLNIQIIARTIPAVLNRRGAA